MGKGGLWYGFKGMDILWGKYPYDSGLGLLYIYNVRVCVI